MCHCKVVNRPFQFHTGNENFFGAHDKTFSVAMRAVPFSRLWYDTPDDAISYDNNKRPCDLVRASTRAGFREP
jgi:hypothetical protein